MYKPYPRGERKKVFGYRFKMPKVCYCLKVYIILQICISNISLSEYKDFNMDFASVETWMRRSERSTMTPHGSHAKEQNFLLFLE